MMDNLEHKIKIPPLIHLLPESKQIRGTDVLLISNQEGDKSKVEYRSLTAQLEKELVDKIVPPEIVVKVTIDDIFNAFKDQSSVHFIKPINILNDKAVEKNTKNIGAIYFDGERLRLCTKEGWKTIPLIQ